MRKIILLGYMGCGKSTIAKSLSRTTAIPFADLDEYIVNKTKMSISDIFNSRGEIYFRKLEHEAFLELLQSADELIIGLGGGTPCYANNHQLLNGDNVYSIYLQASVETLFKRLSVNRSKRPLIASMDDNELKEFIGMHVFERSYFYNQARFIVHVDAKSIDQVVNEIISLLA